MALTQSEIVRGAIEILDEGGLSGLTLRALASRLGVAAPTLYWHVKGKRHLLDLMSEEIFTQCLSLTLLEPAPGQPWWEWLEARSRSIRQGLLAHIDGALVVAGNRPSPRAIPSIERGLAALVKVGFTPPEALQCLIALNTYIIGDAVETESIAAREPDELTEVSQMVEVVHSGEHPNLSEAAAKYGTAEERFEFGLALLLEGMKRRLV